MKPCEDRTTDVPRVPGSAYPGSDPVPGTVEAFYERNSGEVLLWTAAIGAPLLWAIQFQTNYGLADWACNHDRQGTLRWINGAFFLLAIGCGLIALYIWVRMGARWPHSNDEGIRARTRLLATIGLFSALLFGMLIFAQGLPSFIFGPCEL